MGAGRTGFRCPGTFMEVPAIAAATDIYTDGGYYSPEVEENAQDSGVGRPLMHPNSFFRFKHIFAHKTNRTNPIFR